MAGAATTCDSRAVGQRGVGVAALGADHRASRRPSPSRRRACRPGRRRRARRRRASPGPGRGSARPRRPGRRRPAPRPTPATSIALPAVSPSGVRHVGEQRDRVHAGVAARARPSSRPARGRASTSFMNAPVPTLTSSTSAPVPSAIFLLMIERRDQRDRLDGAGDVAQRVELLVGRGQPVAGRADHRADRLELREHLLVGQRRPPARDRLELVERAAGVAEPAPGQLGHGDAARRDQRRQRQRDLVADAAGRVLVGGRPGQRRRSPSAPPTRSSRRSSGRSRGGPCR